MTSLDFPLALSAATVSGLIVLLKLTCVLAVALGVTAVMSRQSAGARHLVWLVALVAALVLPFVSAWSPVPLRVLPAESARAAVATVAPAASPRAAEQGPPAPATVTVPAATTPASRRPIGIGAVLLVLWALGVAALLGRLAIGAWIVRRIVRSAQPLEQPDWQRPRYEIADRLDLEQAPRLVQSDRVKMPFATGFLNAVIVLPAESATWSEERRCAVLIHELAHVKRRDLVGHMVSRVVCALYWFHPLVWTAARHLRAESERACDDLALVLGTKPSDYAEHLLEIVTEVRDERMPAVALAMAKPNEFEGRMLAILDPRRRRKAPGRAQAAWLVGTLAMLALVVGAVSPARRAIATPHPIGADASRALLAAAEDGSGSATDQIKDDSDTKDTAKDKTKEKQLEKEAEKDAEKDADSDELRHDANDVHRAQILAKSLRTGSDAEVRRVAAWGLSQYNDDDVAAKALAEAVAQEKDEDVREMATWALADSKNAAAVTAIGTALRTDKSAKVRQTAAWAAGSIGSPSLLDELTSLLGDADPDVREVAAWSIGNCAPEDAKAPPALVKALGDANRDVRLSVAWALHVISDPTTADAIEAAFRREKDPEVQHGLIRALGSMGDRAVPTLTRLVDSADPEVRAVAVTSLAGGHSMEPWPWPRPEPRPYP